MPHARSLAFLVLLSGAATAGAQTCGDGIQEKGQSLCVSGPLELFATNGEVRTVLAADVNVDSHVDTVAVTATAVYLRFGVPGSPLGAIVRRMYGGDLADMAIGHFNDNGRPDLAITDRASDRVLVSYDFGDGDLAIDATFAVGDGPTRIRTSDFDGDGLDDLAVLNEAADSVSVLRSSGAGFGAAVDYAADDAVDFALGDADGQDGDDLIFVTGQGPGALLNVRRNNALGLLLPAIQSAYALEFPDPDCDSPSLVPSSITAADLDGDAMADVVVGTNCARLVPGLATGGGGVAQMPYPWAWAWASTDRRLRTVDWDRDSHTDIAAPHVFSTRYSVAWGNGNGTFGFHVPGGVVMYAVENLGFGTVQPVRDVAFADFTEDGHPDVVVGTGANVVFQRGNP